MGTRRHSDYWNMQFWHVEVSPHTLLVRICAIMIHAHLFANSYFLGKRAADEGRVARYATIDFCKDPSAICSRSEHPELKWIAGMFYWMSSLQVYDNGWNYLENLKDFVRGGMQDEAFIDAVSGIVNRGKWKALLKKRFRLATHNRTERNSYFSLRFLGCHNPPCGTGTLDGGQERKENFKSKSFIVLRVSSLRSNTHDILRYRSIRSIF